MSIVRQAAMAGSFYPDDPTVLRAEVEAYLSAVKSDAPCPKALIVPHAGYVYSGAVAASAYGRLKNRSSHVRKVILLGPAHQVPVLGLALPKVEVFASPLGDILLDNETLARMAALPFVEFDDSAHALEHSLEVQLPFLQIILDDFQLLPILVGEASPEQVESLLIEFGGGPETLIVVSSDLSHFLEYREAQRIDAATCRAIESLETEGWTWESACGRNSILGLLRLAHHLNMTVESLDLRNSGDTAGDKDRVVGYGAWAFHERGDSV
jgi:MEMO1 family protein